MPFITTEEAIRVSTSAFYLDKLSVIDFDSVIAMAIRTSPHEAIGFNEG